MKANILFLISFFLLSIISCTEDITSNVENKKLNDPSLNDIHNAFDEFSSLLSIAVANSAEIREFIKTEALKMFNKDYDVFYPIIKDIKVSNDKTFREIIKDFDTEDRLEIIEKKLPLLTIHIPELLSGFNAKDWDTAEIPHIVPNIVKNDSASFYQGGTIDFKCHANLIPGFPVLIVKNNERIVRNNLRTRTFDETTNINSEYSFIDETFNGTYNKSPLESSLRNRNSEVPQLIAEEYHLKAFDEAGLDGILWQRDNIYYGLTKEQDRGPLKRNFTENIALIEFSKAAYLKIADQNDPKLERTSIEVTRDHPDINNLKKLLWGEGYYEFKIDIYINNLSGLGTLITRFFSARPYDLFSFDYHTFRQGNYVLFEITSEMKSNPYILDIDLIPWDLQNNSAAWKFVISEIDDQETYTTQSSIETSFATNFEFDTSGTFNETIKVGHKFGSSSQDKRTNNYTIVTHKNSDDLGTLEAFFYDPIIIEKGRINRGVRSVTWYEMNNSMVSMILRPKKIY